MDYKIPLFKLNFDSREEKAILDTIRSKWISMGPKCIEFENLFSKMFNVKHSISLSNCTDALHLALKALNIGETDEVLCPSLSFAATVNCIKYVGATPIFCDIISTDDLNIDIKQIELKYTPKTKAIIVVHFAGFPCNMESIMNFAREKGLKVIEDASHAPLSEFKGKILGTIGDAGCFSFFANKTISTGEGGMLVTNNENLAKKIRLLRSHGMSTNSYERSSGHVTEYDITVLGYNCRMDDMRASIGIEQIKKLKTELRKRKKIREKYIKELQNNVFLTIPFKIIHSTSSNYIFPVVLSQLNTKKRNAVRNFLHQNGIQTSVHYPAIHWFSIYQKEDVYLPITEYVSKNIITLPMYGSLSTSEVNYICDSLQSYLNE